MLSSTTRARLAVALYLWTLIFSFSDAFDPQANNNLVNYWGQNSLGATGGDKRLWQKPLTEYCESEEGENVIVLAFLHVFNSAQRDLPRVDFSNQCDPSSVFQGTSLLHCPQTGAGVKRCQSKGKAILLSLGGAAGAYGFSNDAEGKDFAHMIWNLFLGGSSTTRPFDDAVLDGVDLDIEGGSTAGYPAFISELRSLFATDTRKKYYISAAPQCPFPDAYLGPTLQVAWVDMVFVQFYNNYCGIQAFGTFNFNFEQWDNWAKTTSVNKNVKIYLGVPASRTAANGGYVSKERLAEITDALRCKYSSFGGVMMWDTSQAYGNIDPTGVQYSIATDRKLKQPMDQVCQSHDSHHVPAPPSTSAPPAHLPAAASAPQAPLVTFVEPMSPDSPQQRRESICPVQGERCKVSESQSVCDGYQFANCINGRWVLRRCAPGTYCTPHGCEFIKGPVKTCRELEQEVKNGKPINQIVREAMDQVWSGFGNAVDSSWVKYLGIVNEDSNEQPPAMESEPEASLENLQQQHAFQVPGLAATNLENFTLDNERQPFMIDFIELDASPEIVSFALGPERHHKAVFRTQVRIRTNRDAISPMWRVSFFVKPGQTVETTSRGHFHQRGLQVFVASNPNEEVEHSMVVRFVIEGIKTLPPSSHGDSNEDVPPAEGGGDFAAASLPDPASAVFETEPYPLSKSTP